MENEHLEILVSYNWPFGQNSIRGISFSPYTLDYKITIWAEKENQWQYSFPEIYKGKYYSIKEIDKIISKNAIKGKYLTGDNFYVELNNQKSFKLEASKQKPSNATGATSVDSNYFFEI